MFSIEQERDGIIRRVPMVMQAQGNIVTSLTFEMLRLRSRIEHASCSRGPIRHQRPLPSPGLEVPTDAKGKL